MSQTPQCWDYKLDCFFPSLTWALTVLLCLAWNLPCRQHCPGIHRVLTCFSSSVLGLTVWTAMPGVRSLFSSRLENECESSSLEGRHLTEGAITPAPWTPSPFSAVQALGALTFPIPMKVFHRTEEDSYAWLSLSCSSNPLPFYSFSASEQLLVPSQLFTHALHGFCQQEPISLILRVSNAPAADTLSWVE